ncbi:hypothetical protein IM876_09145 [Serratia plymuthica]|uniref:hypothetical protein n=1 Tax=Serratia plymuthica TaxID=82996 RepID=UPI0019258249|nr:hypothetical protein [Serratia plymuthica]MBL3522828.1 hypothetical protein [Serratia plymuthica]
MSSLSYCLFRNTHSDLDRCAEKIGDINSIDDLSAGEAAAAHQSDGAAQKANFNLISAAPELFEALQAALEWIDAVPQGVQLPTMPGFERDWVDGVINKALGH